MPSDTEFTRLQGKLRSLVEWDVLQFFHHNPHTVEGAQTVANTLGRDTDTVNTALNAMKGVGLLQAVEAQTQPMYRLTQDDTLREEIEQFMRACDNPAFRRQVIERIVTRGTQR